MILLLCTLLSVAEGIEFQNGIVNTTYGRIQGSLRQEGRFSVYQFLKVPYAQPPLGSMRFSKPQAPVPWNGVLNATKPGPSCIQKISKSYRNFLPNMDVSEDCLYMNIYVPSGSNTSNIPVMVYIHGGGYYKKSANLHDGARISAVGDVVVILINYRLGMFGFLSTGDDQSRGNYGLWDQIQALEWIQGNIRNFGGDPSRVTVFGHSAGGYSIGLLLLSKHSLGLFHRAIATSGLGLNKRAITHDARNAAFRVAKFVGCYNAFVEFDSRTLNSSHIVSCLKSKTPVEILVATGKMQTSYNKYDFIMRPGPVIDGDFLLDSPEHIMNNPELQGFRTFRSADVMAGTNDEDGWLLKSKLKDMQRTYNFSLDTGVSFSAMCDGVVRSLVRDYFHSDATIANKICKRYSRNSSIVDQGHSTLDMYGDVLYAAPAVQTLRKHRSAMIHLKVSERKKTYHFLFVHKPSFPVVSSRRSWLTGAQHGDEVWFIFKNKNFNYTEEETKLNDDFVRYLTNFAKSGNPNDKDPETFWPAFDSETESYLKINRTMTVGEHMFKDRMTFWLETVPSLQHDSTSSHGGFLEYSAILSIIVIYDLCERLL